MAHLIKWWFCTLFMGCIWYSPCKAQGKGDSTAVASPDKEVLGSPHTISYCSPGVLNKSRSKGVELSYSVLDGGRVDQSNRLRAVHALKIKVKVPIFNKPRLKVLLGYDYTHDHFRYQTNRENELSHIFQEFHRVNLKYQGLGLYGTYAINHKYYLAGRVKVQWQGDYTGFAPFEDRYANYKFGAVFGYKRTPNEEWGVGININHDFRRTLALPFIIYNKTFNERWGLEAVLPAQVFGRYNVNEGTIILAGARFHSRSYAVQLDRDYIQYHFRQNAVLTLLSIERQIVPWVWANVTGGYQWNLTTHYESLANDRPDFQLRQPNNFYFRAGIFISPPRRVYR